MSEELCHICKTLKSKYTCPKCNILYCSVACYKSKSHLECSEQFYKNCIQEELVSQASGSKNREDAHKIMEILQRVSNGDTVDPLYPNEDEQIEELDSDDEAEEQDLLKRIEGINMNDADQLWSTLSKAEKLEFETLIQSGEIVDLVPEFEPFWIKQIARKAVTDIDFDENLELSQLKYPKIEKEIADFDKIMRKDPHPTVKYNLLNLLGCYANTVRFFAGDHMTSCLAAASYLWTLSSVLNKNMNFSNEEEALKAIILDGQEKNLGLDNEEYPLLHSDVQNILNGPFKNACSDVYKLAVLSDVRNLFAKAKSNCNKKVETKNVDNFTSKFADFQIHEDFTKDKMKQSIKKIDFFLSYVKSKKYIQKSDTILL